MPGKGSTLRLGHLAGVPIGVQPLWLVIVALITFALGHDYFPTEDPALGPTAAYTLGLVSALLLFAGILLHELGHAVVARNRGLEVDGIDLWLLGGVSRIHGEPHAPGDELRFALAGPAVTLAILVVLVPLSIGLGDVLPDWARALLDYQVFVTAAILVFNMLPAFPLDGGRVVRALLWRRFDDRERATTWAASIGRGFGYVLVAFGILALVSGAAGGLWLALVGGFIIVAASAEEQGVRIEHALGERTVAQLMSPDPATLRAGITLDDAVARAFSTHLFTAFPVVDDTERAVGLLSLRDVRAVPAAARGRTLVDDAMSRDPALFVAPGLAAIELVQTPAFARAGRAVVVGPLGHPIGLVSVTDVERRLRADAGLSSLHAR